MKMQTGRAAENQQDARAPTGASALAQEVKGDWCVAHTLIIYVS